MTRTCHVHIGMMKTNSTSIQAAFHGYDDGRLRYLPFEKRNHSSLLRAVLKDRPDPTLQMIALEPSEAKQRQMRRRHRNHFKTMIRESDHDLIVSSEELTTTFSPAHIARLVRLLLGDFDDVHVVAYVREPISFMSKIFGQRTRLAMPELDPAALYPNYRRLFGRWLEVVDARSFEAVQFHRDHFRKGELVGDFATRVDAEPNRLNTERQLVNQTLTAEALAVLYAYRLERGSPRDDSALARHNGRAIAFLERFGSRPFEIDRDGCRREIERRPDDIRFVERLMKSPFEYRTSPARGAVEFNDASDVTDYAVAMTPALVARVRDLYPHRRRDVESLIDALDVVHEEPPPRADRR